MSIDLHETLSHGGKELIDLLSFCVYSVQPEPLFVFLVREYRQGATAPRALALFDVFCTAGSPACVAASAVLPPRDLRLDRELRPVRLAMERLQATPSDAEDRPALAAPPRHLFDFVVEHLQQRIDGPLQTVAQEYDPGHTPMENLGGRLNASQRYFVDKVWQPRLRPRLVAAGFWRVGTVGG